ncbi:hypothetical protein ACIRRA_37440 [Nocardia sp. NPDC101769]|uniref:hypothetical protein n=1 Tax=Nocardia sp. NPDC101769 TaxID=3364333 RepID=UPI0038156B79
MGTNIESILYLILQAVRYIGILILIISSMAILISEAAKNKLSPSKILTVVGSAIIAALLFWVLPNLIYYARSDTGRIVPDRQIGQYGR